MPFANSKKKFINGLSNHFLFASFIRQYLNWSLARSSMLYTSSMSPYCTALSGSIILLRKTLSLNWFIDSYDPPYIYVVEFNVNFPIVNDLLMEFILRLLEPTLHCSFIVELKGVEGPSCYFHLVGWEVVLAHLKILLKLWIIYSFKNVAEIPYHWKFVYGMVGLTCIAFGA